MFQPTLMLDQHRRPVGSLVNFPPHTGRKETQRKSQRCHLQNGVWRKSKRRQKVQKTAFVYAASVGFCVRAWQRVNRKGTPLRFCVCLRKKKKHNFSCAFWSVTYQGFVLDLLADELVFTQGVAGLSSDGVDGPLFHLLLDGAVQHEQRLPSTLLRKHTHTQIHT